MSETSLAKVKPSLVNQNLSGQIYQILRQNIITGKFFPGMKIQEEDLSKELGVSRTPIRESLSLLEKNGLIKIVPRKGNYVIRLTRQEIIEIFDVREGLEGIAANLAAQRTTAEHLKRIRRSLQSRLETVKRFDFGPYYPPDLDFHKILIEMCGNQRLMDCLMSIWDQFLTLRVSSASHKGRAKESVKEHMEIYRMLEKRDFEGAERSMRRHIRNAKENLLVNYLY